MGWLPTHLRIDGRHCLMVGGGNVAERKTRKLVEAGAFVTVLAVDFSPGLNSLATGNPGVRLVKTSYRPGQATGYDLVFAATNDAAVNEQVCKDAGSAWVNRADAEGSMRLTADLSRGPLLVSIATGGDVPALARAIRDELDSMIPQWLGLFAEALGRVRAQMGKSGRNVEILKELCSPEMRRICSEIPGVDEMEAELWKRVRKHDLSCASRQTAEGQRVPPPHEP